MIRTETSVPETYYKNSRDFQFLGRIFDALFNSIKTNSELVETNPFSDNMDEKMVDLLTLTLGFKSRHQYNIKQLTAMCAAFTRALKCKGTEKSIRLAVDTLLGAEGITQPASIFIDEENSLVQIFIPLELKDTNLLKDLLDYILPAGMSCEIIRQLVLKIPSESYIAYDGSNQVWAEKYLAAETSITPTKEVADTSFIPSEARPGLLDNSTVVGKTLKE